MKSFSKLHSDFWINYDNTEVISLGADVQLMALYLQGNSHRNILGAYYLPLLYISSDLRLSVKKIQMTLEKLCQINYCKYDIKTQYVWVCNTLTEQIGETIDTRDNRIKPIHEIWKSLPSQLGFLQDIYNKYGESFYLEPRLVASVKSCEIKAVLPASLPEILIDTQTLSEEKLLEEERLPDKEAECISIEPTEEKLPKNELATNILIEPKVYFNLSKPASGKFAETNSFANANAKINSFDDSETNFFTDTEINSSIDLDTNSFVGQSDSVKNLAKEINLAPVAANNFPISAKIITPSCTPSDPLRSPSEGALEALRSNIEERSNNIENRSNNIKDINNKKETRIQTMSPSINSGAQPQAAVGDNICEKPPGKFYLCSEKLKAKVLQDQQQAAFRDNVCDKPADKIDLPSEKPKEAERASSQSQQQFPDMHNLKPIGNLLATIKPKLVDAHTAAVFDQKLANARTTAVFNQKPINACTHAVFDHWTTTMSYPNAYLDAEREALINNALRNYSVAQLCDAINGCALTPFHMGANQQGQHYTELHHILGNASKIDKFIKNCHNPPKPRTDADQRQGSNLTEAEIFVKRMQKIYAEENNNV